MDSSLDYSGNRKKERLANLNRAGGKRLHNLLAKHELRDAWRTLYPTARDYIYHSSQFNSFSRLDFILVSDSLERFLLEAEVRPIIWSDHAWVEVKVHMLDKPRPRPNWKLNLRLLYLDSFYSDIKKEISDYFELNDDCGVSPQIVWDAMKAVLQGRIISLTSAYLKQKERHKRELLETIVRLECQHKCTCSKKVYRSLMAEKQKLDLFKISKNQKNILYLKHRYWLRIPKALKSLSWKVCSKRAQCTVQALKDADGKTVVSDKDIQAVFVKFYSELYSSSSPSPSKIQEYLITNFPGKRLSEEQAVVLDAQVSPKEVTDIILSLKNKAPGEDGFPVEFYKRYAESLAGPLANLFNDILTSGSFPPSWNTAIITVIPKTGRDQLVPKSYCPISLLNQDYKVFTALLAKHLNKIVPRYIDPDQTGFIPFRDIMDNVFKMLGVIHYCKSQNMSPSLVLSLDIEKAFDCVESPYIFQILKHMSFGSKFQTAIQAIYKQPSARVRVNGLLSSSFKISRGTRQGCPLSPLLFVLAMEPLAETLRASQEYQGVKIGNQHVKLNLFSDNMVLFVTDPLNSLQDIENILDRFEIYPK